MSSDDQRQFQMTGRQQLVYRSIAEKSQELAELYECALRAIGDGATSNRFFMAAHAVRLIINDLPAIFDLPKLTSLPLLSNKIRDLDPVWRGALDSGCRMEGAWKGEIDKPLRTLLQSLEEFYAWREEQPSKKRIAADLLRRTDPAVIELPQRVYEKGAERWLKLFGYFNAVAHRSTTSLQDFEFNLNQLEQIVLDSIYRRPSEDFSAIDAILAEETPDA